MINFIGRDTGFVIYNCFKHVKYRAPVVLVSCLHCKYPMRWYRATGTVFILEKTYCCPEFD